MMGVFENWRKVVKGRVLVVSLIVVEILLTSGGMGLAQEPGEERSATAWSDSDCIARSQDFVIPAGWIGTKVRAQAGTSFSPCTVGAGHTDMVGYAVTGPVAWSGGVTWEGGTYGTKPPDILPSGSYTISLERYGKNDSYTLYYTLQPDTCTPGEQKTVSAWSDDGCVPHETLFTIPTGCVATDISTSINASWLPCSGPGHPDMVGYVLTGPGGSWARGVTWEGEEYGPALPANLPAGSYRFEMDAWGKLDSCELSYTLRKAGGGLGIGVTPTIITPGTGGGGGSGALDIIFCIDVTGSMDDDIDSVKAAAANIVDTIAAKNADHRVAIVAYRDWDDSEGYPMFEDYAFSTDKSVIISNINSLSVGGGDDVPEAVFEALMRAIDSTSVGGWRNNVNKQIILMGDAPPHNPSREGLTPVIVAKAAEEADPVVIQAVVVGNEGIYDPEAVDAFRELASLTGGNFFEAKDASRVPEVLQEIIKDIEAPETSILSSLSMLLGGGLCLVLFVVVGAVVVIALVVVLVRALRPKRRVPAQVFPPTYPMQGQFARVATLSLLQGQAQPTQFSLSQPVARFGRAPQGNDVLLYGVATSGHHAEIRLQGGGHLIRDLGSTNGTFVNGVRIIQPQQLRNGDRITIGDTEWLYRQT
jgi:Mg-chelatase subunit ChlD